MTSSKLPYQESRSDEPAHPPDISPLNDFGRQHSDNGRPREGEPVVSSIFAGVSFLGQVRTQCHLT
jgi:hypothetical protein